MYTGGLNILGIEVENQKLLLKKSGQSLKLFYEEYPDRLCLFTV